MKKIIIINGPNLNLLGKRQPEVYGNIDFDIFLTRIKTRYNNLDISYFQSNVEGEIINKLHEIGFIYDGIVLNAAAYTHTSVGIGDAVASIKVPVVEVHISNIHSREEFRKHSYISKNAKGVIVGFGLDSYRLALETFL